MHKILAIETSCDDTSISIVRNENNHFHVESCIAYSQVADHQQYGGVVPEIASRLHAEKIIALLDTIGSEQIQSCDAVAVTTSPGLPGSLLVGKTTAHFLGTFFQKPIIPVYHIYGHIFSILLERSINDFPFPRIILTASGGHNDIYLVDRHCEPACPVGREKGNDDMAIQEQKEKYSLGKYNLTKIGYTLDDAAGECFDKVSRMLGGPYPGGAWIGEKASKGNLREDIVFKRIFLSKDSYEFSFSGMKSQVHYLLENRKKQENELTEQDICDIAYAFQEAVIEVLAKKTIRAAIQHQAKTIAIVGGVSANTRLREYINEYKDSKYPDAILTKPIKNLYSTDNGAMIGAAALVEKL